MAKTPEGYLGIVTRLRSPAAGAWRSRTHFATTLCGAERSRIFRVAWNTLFLCLAIALASGISPAHSQNQSPLELERLERRINTVEDSLNKQVQGIDTMVCLATIVFATVAGGFALFGFGTYVGLMKEIRGKFTNQLGELEKMRGSLDMKLLDSEKLEKRVLEFVQLQENLVPAVLLAKVRSALVNEPKPNLAEIAGYLYQLVRTDDATSDDLYWGAMISKEHLLDEGLAKILLKKAKERAIAQGDASYLIEAQLAELSARNPDWREQKRALDDLVNTHPQDPTVLNAATSFFERRADWEGLDEIMAVAQARCPWLSVPYRNRAYAHEKLNKDPTTVRQFYDSAVERCTPETDDLTYKWYANYLMHGGQPRSTEDVGRAIEILLAILTQNPEDGAPRLDLAKLMKAQGKWDAARWQLQLGIPRCEFNQAKKREGEALLEELKGPTVDEEIDPKHRPSVAGGVARGAETIVAPAPHRGRARPRTPEGAIPSAPAHPTGT